MEENAFDCDVAILFVEGRLLFPIGRHVRLEDP